MLTEIAVVVFCIGVIVQTSAMHPSSIFGGECPNRFYSELASKYIWHRLGRFVTGLGVGSLSMAVPLYKYAVLRPFLRRHPSDAFSAYAARSSRLRKSEGL